MVKIGYLRDFLTLYPFSAVWLTAGGYAGMTRNIVICCGYYEGLKDRLQ
jgi:hypothetical protein